MVSTSPPRSRSPPPEGGSASHQLRTYVRTYQNLELRLGLQEIYVRTYHTYVRTYVYFLKPQEVPNGTHVRTIAHGRRSITRTYRFTYVRTSTYVPFHPRTYVRTYTYVPYVRTVSHTDCIYHTVRTLTYVRIVSPTYVRTYVSTYGTYVRTYSFSHVRTCGPCFIYVRTSLHASEPTATALPSPSTF